MAQWQVLLAAHSTLSIVLSMLHSVTAKRPSAATLLHTSQQPTDSDITVTMSGMSHFTESLLSLSLFYHPVPPPRTPRAPTRGLNRDPGHPTKNFLYYSG